jgi:predicted Zn-dependent protease
MIRELGLGIVISAFGGSTGTNINTLLSASYSRGAEREADQGAIRMLSAGSVSPLPTAGFFARLAKGESKLRGLEQGLSYISTHPLSADRQKLFQSSAKKGAAYRPSLTAEEWKALRGICSKRSEK